MKPAIVGSHVIHRHSGVPDEPVDARVGIELADGNEDPGIRVDRRVGKIQVLDYTVTAPGPEGRKAPGSEYRRRRACLGGAPFEFGLLFYFLGQVAACLNSCVTSAVFITKKLLPVL